MNCKKLSKIRRQLDKLQARGGVTAADLESIAKKLGRKSVSRGKEPTWESDLPNTYPLSIPHHGNSDLPVGTKINILEFLERDYETLFEILKCGREQ